MNKSYKKATAVLTPVAVILIYIFSDRIMSLAPYLGGCIFHSLTGIWCPGCGNTRSISAMFEFDFMLALRNNALIPFLSLCLLCFYLELIADISGRKIKILPRKIWIWCIVIVIFAVYYVMRNFIPAIAPV
ncbi:MAG: DUF2752 domain-containing protein [Ruminococcus sp.]|nr:DUF2752 domain-containing protein [Ruminococcus sp.]MDE7226124.1 DUF2752 domain-containing protein [Ruminococcus sp.]